jgi:hypothetical protein
MVGWCSQCGWGVWWFVSFVLIVAVGSVEWVLINLNADITHDSVTIMGVWLVIWLVSG